MGDTQDKPVRSNNQPAYCPQDLPQQVGRLRLPADQPHNQDQPERDPDRVRGRGQRDRAAVRQQGCGAGQWCCGAGPRPGQLSLPWPGTAAQSCPGPGMRRPATRNSCSLADIRQPDKRIRDRQSRLRLADDVRADSYVLLHPHLRHGLLLQRPLRGSLPARSWLGLCGHGRAVYDCG